MQPTRKILIDWVDSFDPGFLALKRSLKTFAAVLISLAVFWQTPGMAMFAAISSMLFSRSQAGFTIRERRFTMLATGITMVLLSVPVTLVSQNEWAAVAFVLVASFITFFLIGNRVVPDFPAVSVLALSVVEMAFSHTIGSGIHFAGLFMLTLALVYILHFVLWPTRPRQRLKAQIAIITKNLLEYDRAIRAGYTDEEVGIKATQEIGDRVRRSIGDFRRLWQLFGMRPDDNNIVENRYLDIYTAVGKIHEYLILSWQFRVSVWNSKIFSDKIIRDQRLREMLHYLIQRQDAAIIKPSERKLPELLQKLDGIATEYLEQMRSEYRKEQHRGWVAVINSIKALETLVNDLQHSETPVGMEAQEFSSGQKIKSFFQKSLQSVSKMGFSHSGFKLALRSMLIIGATKAWTVLRDPEYGYWLVLFAVLLIRPNLGISIKVGKQRLLGTIAGSVLALGFVFIIPPGSATYLFFLLVSLFFMLWFINIDRMVPMVTALTFMIIGLFYMIYPEGGNLVWLRIVYTAAIVLLVIIASFLLWPEKARKKFALTLADAIQLEKDFFGSIMDNVLTSSNKQMSILEKQKIRDQIQRLNDVIDATKNEVIQEKVIIHGLNIRSYIMRLLNTLQSMEATTGSCDFGPGFSDVYYELQKFTGSILQAFDALIDALHNQTDVVDFPGLRSDFEQLRRRFRENRYTGDAVVDDITRFWKNSTLIWNFKPLTLELEGIKNEINLKMAEV